MKEETTISKNIRITEDKARYDTACKQLLSEKIILAWIMKSCVEEFRDVQVKEIADRYIEGEPQVAEIPVAPNDENYGGVLKLLDVLLSNETGAKEKQKVLWEDFDIPMSQTLGKKVGVMCNLSEGVWEKGIQQGIQQGMQQGIQQGMLESIRNLTETMGWPVQKSMDALKVPKGDQPMYEEWLSGNYRVEAEKQRI